MRFFVSDELTGNWVENTDGATPRGFVLCRGGGARSINAANPQYTAWRRDGHTLTLWGRTITNGGRVMDFIESMRIGAITPDKLVLHRADETYEYNRE